MRFRELTESDYIENLRSEIITLLTAVGAEGITKVDTKYLLRDLKNQGFSIDTFSLLDLISRLKIVQTANKDIITLSTNKPADVSTDQNEIDIDRVDNLAAKQSLDTLGGKL